jgi:hypothetical protein
MPVALKGRKEENLSLEKGFEKLEIREKEAMSFAFESKEGNQKANKRIKEALKILGITAGFSAISVAAISKLIKLPSELFLFLPPIFLAFIFLRKTNSIKDNGPKFNKSSQQLQIATKDINERLKQAIDIAIREELKSKKEKGYAPLDTLLNEIEKIIRAKPVMQLIDKIESGNINIKIGEEKPVTILLLKSDPFLFVVVGFDYKILLRATYLLGCNAIKEINYVSSMDSTLVERIMATIRNGKVEVKIGREERMVFEK